MWAGVVKAETTSWRTDGAPPSPWPAAIAPDQSGRLTGFAAASGLAAQTVLSHIPSLLVGLSSTFLIEAAPG